MKRLKNESEVIQKLQEQGRVFQYRNPTLEQAKEAKFFEIEQERIKRTEFMPFTLSDGTTQVQVKIAEEPPHKPRQTWLAGTSAWGIAKIQEGNSTATDDLIAADDSLHTMTASEWRNFGKALKEWVRDNLMAAKNHKSNVQNLTDIQSVIDYDYSSGWPS